MTMNTESSPSSRPAAASPEHVRLTARAAFLEAENRHLRERVAATAPPTAVQSAADRREAERLADLVRRAHDRIGHMERSYFWRARRLWVALNALFGRER